MHFVVVVKICLKVCGETDTQDTVGERARSQSERMRPTMGSSFSS